jgi:hypothetical protein
MYVDMYGLPFVCFKRCVCALETEARVWTKHAFGDGSCKGVCDYVWEYVSRVYDGILLDVSCAQAEVMVCCCAVIKHLSFGNHAGV